MGAHWRSAKLLHYNFTLKYCICSAVYLQQHTVNYGAFWENVMGG